MYYHTCPDCGANLDPGELCDCRKKAEAYKNQLKKLIRVDKRGQLTIKFTERTG